jgi:hypothetical protein
VVPEHMPGGNKARPQGLLEVCPSGTVPCIRHGNWGAWESGVLMEYVSLCILLPCRALMRSGTGWMANMCLVLQLEDLSIGHALLPLGEPRLRAHCRLWTDHVSPSSSFDHCCQTLSRLCCADKPQSPASLLRASSHATHPVQLSPL